MGVIDARDDNVAHIRLSRKESLNAMNRQMYADVNKTFQQLNDDDQTHVTLYREGELNVEYGKIGKLKLLKVPDS